MNIMHVADFLPGFHHTTGGAEYAALRTIEQQVARGASVSVATLRADTPQVRDDFPPLAQMNNLDRYAPRAAYSVKQLFLPSDPLSGGDMRRILARERPDLVHFHNLHFAGFSPLIAARRAGVPTVMTIYDYWLFCPSFMLLTNKGELCSVGHSAACVDCVGARRARWMSPLKRAAFSFRPRIFGRIQNAVDHFITLSDASGEVLKHHGIPAQRVSTVHQPLWQQALAAGAPAPVRPGRLVYAGWIEARKGLHVVVDAFTQLASEFPELELDVLGMAANADYESTIRAQVREHQLEGRINFLGKQSSENVLAALREAFLVLVPEQWENMSPVIVAEAMAAGACVLASRVGGIPEFIEHGKSGLMAQRDSATSYAEQIRRAMRDPQAVDNMRRSAQERARRVFASDVAYERHMAIYAAVGQRRVPELA